MLVHISVRNSAGEVHLDKVVNDAEARRVMDKAIEKSAEFTVRHHKAKAPPRVEVKDHEAAVAGARAIAESDREDIYAAGYAAMVDKLAEAMGLEIGTDDVACLEALAEKTAPSEATPAKQSKQ